MEAPVGLRPATAAPILHGGGVTEAARAYGGEPADWLDLSTGINPCPAPLPAIPPQAWHRLPDRHLHDAARQAARTCYGAACLPLPVPGTQSVIQHLPKLCPAGKRAAVVSPTYGEYARVLSAASIAVDLVSDPRDITPAHGLAVVVNPNNPTGTRYGRDELLALHRRLHEKGTRLHVDEAFADSEGGNSLAGDAGALAGLTVFRSFGKFYGLAGLRLGFVLAQEADLERFGEWLGPWPVSGPALYIASHLMAGDGSALRARIGERHAGLLRTLQHAGLAVIGGTSLFALVETGSAARLHEHLCRHRILVRKFDYDPRWLRFGLTPGEAEDKRLLRALQDFRP